MDIDETTKLRVTGPASKIIQAEVSNEEIISISQRQYTSSLHRKRNRQNSATVKPRDCKEFP